MDNNQPESSQSFPDSNLREDKKLNHQFDSINQETLPKKVKSVIFDKIKSKLSHLRKSSGQTFKHSYTKFRNVFMVDVRIRTKHILLSAFRMLILSSLMTFWISVMINGLPQYEFSKELRTSVFIVGSITLIVSGIFVDSWINQKFLFEILVLAAIITIIVMIYAQNPLNLILCAYLLGFLNALTLNVLLTGIIAYTNLLNRARIITMLLSVMTLFSAPIITLIATLDNYDWVWIMLLIFNGFSAFFFHRFFSTPYIGQIKAHHYGELSFRDFLKVIWSSNIIYYFIFFILSAFAISFYMSSELYENFDTQAISTLVIAALISLPLIAIVLDKIGRKPIAFLTLFMLGLISIFFDYPNAEVVNIAEIRFIVFMFSALLILILMLVIAGDLSTNFSRGRVIGFLSSGLLIGAIAGPTFFNSVTEYDINNLESLAIISDWASLIIFGSVFLVAITKEPFDSDNPDWRMYTKKLYLISNTGISLYSVDFNEDSNDNDGRVDLITGGLTGIQSMLQEIAQSKQKIKVLDHGDLFLIFHYGQYSTSVLFVKKDLGIFREKLANFHSDFERLNQKRLVNFYGNVSALVELDHLKRIYFE